MATRASSRRSAGGADVLNRVMINLLPLARLKEECEKRGLPVDGNSHVLASRLEDSLDGIYTSPPAAVAPTASTPSTSRNQSSTTTPKSRPTSSKAAQPKRTPRRKNSVTSVASTGEDESIVKVEDSPPKKKPRRNSTKKEQASRECSVIPKEEEIFEEEFSVTILTAPVEPQFDSDDDQPLIRVRKDSAAAATSPAKPATEVENKADEQEAQKEVHKKKKRKRKEDEDIESGVVLPKGDSEWVPPEESERRVTRESAKKRTRRNTTEVKEEEEEEEEDLPSASSMPQLDPEIYDQDANGVEEEKEAKTVEQPKTDVQRKPSTVDGVKKVKKEPSEGTSIDRPRSISIATPAAGAAAAAVSKEKRRESTAGVAPRPPKEKPATIVYAELMAQKKAAAAATANGGGSSSAAGTPTTAAPSAAVKGDSQEKELSGGASPLVTERIRSTGRRDSTGAVGSPAADGSAPRGFSMAARKNAPPRPAVHAAGASSDLLGDLLGKQQSLLQKKPMSMSETEIEKMRIVTQLNQRHINTETVKQERERLQREEEEKRRAKEERERKERERKSSVIAAPTRPIPPPPPPPAKKNDNSSTLKESPKDAVEVKEEEKEDETPRWEPLEESAVDNVSALADVKDSADAEYEPLSPGPSMPPLDRSIADAHHRSRLEKTKERKERHRKDHGLVAPEMPFSADIPFIMSLSDKLRQIQRQRDPSPVPEEVRECMEDLLKKVETKVEKELKWERRTKRKSEYLLEREKEEEKKRAQMMRDPRAFLAKATNILESMHNNGSIEEEADSPSTAAAAVSAIQISQDLAEPGTYQEDTEEKRLPEFHGEPVPSDDDEALFLEAAGLPRKDKRPKHPVVEEEAPPSHEHILMDYYNACLHIKSATDKPWLIDPDNENGLALMWGGVRANHGYLLPWREEKKCLVFQIKITEHQSIRHIPFMEQEPHDVRIGFSLRASPNILGEAPLSWAFCTTGKKCVNNVFQEWGDPVEVGDVVTAVLDFSAKSLSFYKNEECMGVAFKELPLPEDEDAVYAHVCVKNCKVAVNLGSFPPVEGGWGAVEAVETRNPDWLFPSEIERKHYEMSRLPPNEKAACTLLMMVGLPGVGKSTWVRQYTRDHPEEKWDVINAEGVMAAMKVNGVARGRAHTGRWDMILGLVAKALQKMVLLAARRRRNYIVDLSNVNKDSRKRRLMHFKDFTKKCIVLVPDEEEMVNRQMKQTRQEGASHVPAEAILEMKAVFTFPSEEAEGIDEVHLIEPAMPRIAEAIEIIQRFNDEGKPWYQKRYRGRGSRRGGRGGYMGGGGGDRRGSDYNRPLSVSTGASNGSGPPTHVGGGRSMNSPGWGMGNSPSTGGNFSWAGPRRSFNN